MPRSRYIPMVVLQYAAVCRAGHCLQIHLCGIAQSIAGLACSPCMLLRIAQLRNNRADADLEDIQHPLILPSPAHGYQVRCTPHCQ
jgi:hypothetical protein